MAYFPTIDEKALLLSKGRPVCRCGACMIDDWPDYVCPACGWRVDSNEYEYEGEDKDEVESIWVHDSIDPFEGIPEGCRGCNQAYPKCKTSCGHFDD